MKHTKKTSALLIDDMLDAETSTVEPSDPTFGVVIQDNFSADEDRREFMQTITSHGITFLRCANTPLPEPTPDDLSLIERLANVLSGLWAATNKQGRSHDA
jgi:hypothetical protein